MLGGNVRIKKQVVVAGGTESNGAAVCTLGNKTTVFETETTSTMGEGFLGNTGGSNGKDLNQQRAKEKV